MAGALALAACAHAGPKSKIVEAEGFAPVDGRGLADARDRARLPVRVTPHIVRHWHARDLAAHGTMDRLLAARMGWRIGGLVGRYAPVAQREVEADVSRYAPLVRLRDDGALGGLFPRGVLLARTPYSSKNDGLRIGRTTRRPGDPRQS